MECVKRGTVCTQTVLIGSLLIMSANISAGPSRNDLEQRTGLISLEDKRLQSVTAQGIREDSQYLIDLADSNRPDDEGGLKTIMVLLQAGLPLLQLVGDYEINGVTYDDPDAPRSVVNADGTLTLLLPSSIEEIAYRDMQLGETPTGVLGDLYFRNISTLPDSTVTLVPRSDTP
ncbi:MAG: hypothetical protein CSH37_09235 [Thalassolituus sp.]|nr:MAG: hypothetical protein CSH37_09235 [Thalassolituus sp.]